VQVGSILKEEYFVSICLTVKG